MDTCQLLIPVYCPLCRSDETIEAQSWNVTLQIPTDTRGYYRPTLRDMEGETCCPDCYRELPEESIEEIVMDGINELANNNLPNMDWSFKPPGGYQDAAAWAGQCDAIARVLADAFGGESKYGLYSGGVHELSDPHFVAEHHRDGRCAHAWIEYEDIIIDPTRWAFMDEYLGDDETALARSYHAQPRLYISHVSDSEYTAY